MKRKISNWTNFYFTDQGSTAKYFIVIYLKLAWQCVSWSSKTRIKIFIILCYCLNCQICTRHCYYHCLGPYTQDLHYTWAEAATDTRKKDDATTRADCGSTAAQLCHNGCLSHLCQGQPVSIRGGLWRRSSPYRVAQSRNCLYSKQAVTTVCFCTVEQSPHMTPGAAE